jgi:hypothetical protein
MNKIKQYNKHEDISFTDFGGFRYLGGLLDGEGTQLE